ncbi:uncharacterized protein LOC131036604 isoform X2 [Cryptomeria japonica]|uniref:uncharacterized protein LOC131036604 isoform X2 n=1 Tax=Cryptomeria japonica TaxID=3369 RepID=UPI0027DA964E|nr:uncharacterized protein LOC131036604 isoform X2 [Cryptomeria japonica]
MALSTTDLPTLYALLTNALSPDESLRKPAETTLSACENRPGFCSCLLEIIATKNLESQNNARWLASVYFKNSINRYWRNRRDSLGISSAEKPYLRKKLLELIREENHQIAVQLAVLVSKIARIDYPREWPELFSILIQQLQSSDILTTQRVYMVLHRTLKELSTKRLTADQRNFAEITSQFFDYTWHHWRSDMQTILHEFSVFVQSPVGTVFSFERQQALQLTCERWLLCLKTLQRMLISGFQSDARSVQEVLPVKEVCPSMLQAVQSLLQYRSAFQQGHESFCAFADRACLKLMKVLVSVQCVHPYSFSNQNVLPSILDFCYKQITDPEPYIVSFESFLIQCMILFKSVLECKDYKSSNAGRVVGDTVVTLDQAKNNIAREAEKIVKSLMVGERVALLCNVLIRRYLIFSSKDLEEWARDPESFHHDQDMIQWTEKLRPCAEALYLTLFENYRQVLAPMVLDILKEAMGNCLPTEVEITQQMLLKEAAYSAVGMTHYELSNYLSFKGWFEGALLPELHNTHSNRWIIRRRVAWLLGQWVSEIKDEIRKPVYFELLGLLQDKDLAVKLAACRSLCSLFEDVQFYEEDFMDYVTRCLEICFQAMQDVQEFDSKVQILNLISVMIERLGGKIVPSANKLMQFFPQVWDESSGESLLRIQVILAIQNFVVALGLQSPMCYNMLLPILQQSTDVNNPDELNLLEDGVMLWETTLSNATSMVPQLLELFPNLVAIIEKSFDHLLFAMKIIEGYILLGGADFLNLHASGVAKIFDGVVANVNQKGLLSAMPIIEMLVQLFPRDAPSLLGGVLQKIVVFFLSGGDDSDPTAAAIKASAGAILARLLVQNSNYFAHMITESSLSVMLQQAGTNLDQNLLLCLIDAWLDKVDNVTIIPRKAYALALCILLTSRESHILEKLDQIINVCTSILVVDIDNNGSEESSFDSIHSVENHEALQSGAAENIDSRKRQVKSSDPIKNSSLAHVMKENLQACAALHV